MEYQKTTEATGDLIGNKTANAVWSQTLPTRANSYDGKIQMSQEVRHRIIQKQLQINMIKKYLKKDIHIQTTDRKLLIIWH